MPITIKREHHEMFKKVPNPEDYPEVCINEHCRKCEYSQLRYFRSTYHQYKSLLCGASKAHICLNGFIKHEEFTV